MKVNKLVESPFLKFTVGENSNIMRI